jgi:hypothetical protein
MSSLQMFSTHDVKKWEIKPARANPSGQGKSIYMDRSDSDFNTEDLTLAWPIRPSMAPPEGGTVKETERLNLELSIPRDNSQFISKANELDDLIRTKLYDDRVACFGPSKAKALTSKESISVLYKPMLKEGGFNKEGTTQYPDTIRGKVDGWSQNISKLNFVEKDIGGQKMKMVEDCVWSPRFIEQGLKSGDTKFFMFLGKNPETGKDRYTDRLPCIDSNGVKKMRYVGPEDCKRGSKVSVVFKITKVYITETAGPTLSIKEVYIKSLPAKAETKVMDGAELIDESELLGLLENFDQQKVEEQPLPATELPSAAQPSVPVVAPAKRERDDIEIDSGSGIVEEQHNAPPKTTKKKKESFSL